MLSQAELVLCIESRRQRLTQMAAAMLRNEADAEDVVQEASIRALQARASFRSEADVCTWFQRICFNSCYDMARRRRTAQAHIEAAGREALWRDPNYTVDPEAVVVALADGERLAKAIEELTPEQRLAVVLHDLHGWKAIEIAEDTGLPLPTVKSHLRRGRQTLVTMLAAPE
jgi:RNA polymerase sigma-70 factor (ECF subfamily)